VHFQLFIPRLNPVDAAEKPAELQRIARLAGFDDMLLGGETMQCPHGPDGGHGVLMNWTRPGNTQVVYRPAEQTWVPSYQKDADDGRPMYWVGFWNDSPPAESELRRHYTHGGAPMVFGSQTWLLPTPTTVDQRAMYNDDGSMRWVPLREFSWLCDEAELMRERYIERAGEKIQMFETNPAEQVTWLLRLLKVNYRITPEVAVHLDLWSRKNHIFDVFLMTLSLERKDRTDG
jgi:hypothetical protein